MLANVTTPLLGLVDLAVVGRLGEAAPIGAVAVGALIFTFVFWGFGFLRMATSGLTAQALGAQEARADGALPGASDVSAEGLGAHLARGFVLAGGLGLTLLALKVPITTLALTLVDASAEVTALARGYVDVRFWAAPATLANYALMGWLVGLGRTRHVFVIQLAANLSNMALDAGFVLGLGWGVRGVAVGTLLAEHIALAVGLWLALGELRRRGGTLAWREATRPAALLATVRLNGDMLVRTLSLITVFAWFTAQGARFGDVVLAANAVLMQLVGMSAYFLDGVANAAETLCGQAVGARDPRRLRDAIRVSTVQATGVAAVLSLVFWVWGGDIVAALAADPATRATAMRYLPWAAGIPLVGVAAFQLDGIFVGTTRSGAMRNAMLVSLTLFLAGWWGLRPWLNHGLWAAMYVHYAARTVTLGVGLPGVLAAARPRAASGAERAP